MISGKRKCKEIERKSFGIKTGQKQSKNKGKTGVCKISQPKRILCEISIWLRNHFVAQRKPLRNQHVSAKMTFLCETISQRQMALCKNFRSCEAKFGTRVPFHSTGAPISQLRNGCEAVKHENSQFRSKSSIPQGASQLRNQFLAHECHFVEQ